MKLKTDEVGAMSLLTSEVILSSIRSVKRGKILSLGQTLSMDMPTVWFHGPFFYSRFRSVEACLQMFSKDYDNKLGSMVCRYELSDHTGTHVDSLNHATVNYELYGGLDIRDIVTDQGSTRLGIETMPPVFTRGILLDIPSFLGTDMLEPSYEIKPQLIERIMRRERLTFNPGDAILFYTGYSKLWVKNNTKYLEYNPGVGTAAARWIAKKRFSITGSDTSSFEVVKKKTRKLFPCHQILIKENGIHLIENMKLDELARQQVMEFLLVISPLKFKGGAGSPVNPIAVY